VKRSPSEVADTAKAKARQVLDPLAEFLRDEAAGGIALVVAALVALVWANSPAGDEYVSFWDYEATIGVGGATLTEDLRHWVNDGLMALFFFVVGL
jgi:NhaA family Na+:H+ antiporter